MEVEVAHAELRYKVLQDTIDEARVKALIDLLPAPTLEQVNDDGDTALHCLLSKHDKQAQIDFRPYMDPSPYVVSDLMPLRRVYRFFNEIGVRHLTVIDCRVGRRVHRLRQRLRVAHATPSPPDAARAERGRPERQGIWPAVVGEAAWKQEAGDRRAAVSSIHPSATRPPLELGRFWLCIERFARTQKMFDIYAIICMCFSHFMVLSFYIDCNRSI